MDLATSVSPGHGRSEGVREEADEVQVAHDVMIGHRYAAARLVCYVHLCARKQAVSRLLVATGSWPQY